MQFDRHYVCAALLAVTMLLGACGGEEDQALPTRGGIAYDLVIRNGTIYDGGGGPPFVGDVAITGDRIALVGMVGESAGRVEIDATGLAVAPGFINIMSWATESLIADGHAQSDIRQGVTLEVFGEAWSMGPLTESMKENIQGSSPQMNVQYDVEWTTLGEYLEYLEKRGVSTNVASFVGASTIRVHVLGHENRDPSSGELEEMKSLVREAMEEGAMGVGSALVVAPETYSSTEELIALASTAGEYGGMYISHIRSEGDRLIEAVDELITIAREAQVPAEIYHLKAAGQSNWHKLDQVIERVEAARAEGLRITANMYTYTAASSGLWLTMPPWVQKGGIEAWVERLKDPELRARVRAEMNAPGGNWENLYLGAGPDGILFAGFKSETLKPYLGMTLAEIAEIKGTSPEEAAMDLIVEDHSAANVIFFLMSEENVRKKVTLPWVSFCSDAQTAAPEGLFLDMKPHPRTYGSFARLLARYVRDEGIISLEEAVRRLSSLPAETMKLDRRGALKPGYFADIVVFDPMTIQDRATFADPHQYAEGVVHVLVNGQAVIRDGEHTGAKPGRVVRGPGWKGRR